jgi:bifunctional DNA-binding transcriptional regulator/antitoxin component of YhaV-PrlF toxin-antitoxin module
MKAVVQVEADGTLMIPADVLASVGLGPGERVELSGVSGNLVVAPERNVDSIFARWAGIDRSRPPMSLDEIVAEQRELRGHDDLD